MDGQGLTYVLVVLVAVAASGVCRWRGISPALPLLVVGLVLSFVPGLVGQVPSPETVLIFLLAPLVFALALETSYLDLKGASRPIVLLAVGLVVVTTLVVGGVVVAIAPATPFAVACVLGAVLAPTDAIAASSAGRTAGLPRWLLTIIEGESLVNDGAALTLLRVALVAVAAGTVTVGQVGLTLAQSVLVGGAAGALVGAAVAWLLSRIDDQVVGNAAIILTPFLVYLGAEQLGGSGLLGVAIAGVWISHAGSTEARAEVRLTSSVLWGQFAFLLESVAFLFVGLELPSTLKSLQGPTGTQLVLLVLLTMAVLVLTRALFVTVVRLVIPSELRTGRRASLVIIWAGARGPVSVLAAFTIPVLLPDGSPFPNRDEILAVTFGVVLISLLLSLTLGPLVRGLGFEPEDDSELVERARDRAASAAIARLDALVSDARSDGLVVPESLVAGLRGAIVTRRRINRRSQRLTETYLDWRREMLEAERVELQDMRDEGDLPDPVMRDLLREIDMREAALGHAD